MTTLFSNRAAFSKREIVLTKLLTTNRIWALTALRIVSAFLYWQHGAQKLLGVLEGNPPAFLELLWVAGIIEFLGGLLIGAGLFTRPIAFLCSGQMATAYFIAHAPTGFWPVLNNGERAILFCFIFMLISLVGPGKLALDNLLAKKQSS